ncbi:MAG: DNA/RNA nuclease SfsA [Myxococcota bacterium]
MTAPRIPYDPPLVAGRLVRRYKRFLADVVLDDGREVVAHCMNTGSMMGCQDPDSRVWLRPADNPKRKLKWTWEIASDGDVLVGINTQLPNRLARRAVEADAIPGLAGYRSVRREVKYGERSRIDLLLEEHPDDARPCYVEVKNVTLADDGVACFPDAVTKRGLKHLRELEGMVEQGARAVMLYLVQRDDAGTFAPAARIDPDYAAALAEVTEAGVEVEAWRAEVTPEAVSLGGSLAVDLDHPGPSPVRRPS